MILNHSNKKNHDLAMFATKKTRWAREPKSKAAHSTPFLRNLVVWEATLCTKPRQDLY